MNQTLTTQLEVKGLNSRQFEGHGSVFNNVDYGGEIVLPGAFEDSLAEHKRNGSLPVMFWMHDPAKVAGKWLDMREDDYGLAVTGELAKTPLGNEVHELLKMKAVSGMSIGYMTVDHDYDKHGIRRIKKADLWEVSVVSLPMNPLAQVVHVKTRLSERGEYVPTIREFEKSLRDVGCSQSVAKRIISKVFDGEEKPSTDSHREGEQELMDAAQKLFETLLVSRIRPINFS